MAQSSLKSWDLPLDESLYDPDEEAKAFMKTATGIEDDEDLKRHILSVQKKAFSVSSQWNRDMMID